MANGAISEGVPKTNSQLPSQTKNIAFKGLI